MLFVAVTQFYLYFPHSALDDRDTGSVASFYFSTIVEDRIRNWKWHYLQQLSKGNEIWLRSRNEGP